MLKRISLLIFLATSIYAQEENVGPLGIRYSEPENMTEKYKMNKNNTYGVETNNKWDYQVFVSKLGNISNIKEQKEVFFGEKEIYDEKSAEFYAGNATVGMTSIFRLDPDSLLGNSAGIAQNAAIGGIAGLAIAQLSKLVDNSRKDLTFVKVTNVLNKDGSIGKVTTIFVTENDAEYTAEEIRKLIDAKEKEKIKALR